MNTKTKLTALIFATCFVVASAIGIVAWAIAAANIGLNSTLSVTYNAAPHVVCTASANYQKKTDTSATPFQSGTITMNYGDTSGSRTLNASNSALVLNDTNTYVVFEFTFTNNNKMNTMGINITLTDNGICKNMTRKYYFGDLSSSTISQKESTIKSSGIENSALSSTSTTLKQNQTTRIYMLLEITPGVIADYKSNDSNQFLFNLTSVDVTPDKVSYLSADWADRVINAIQNASSTTNNLNQRRDLVSDSQYQMPDSSFGDILRAVPTLTIHATIMFGRSQSTIQNYNNNVSVGTNDISSTGAYTQSDVIEDVTLYWKLINSSGSTYTLEMFFYSPVIIYAPKNSTELFGSSDFMNIVNNEIGYEPVYADNRISKGDFSELDISLVDNFTNFFNGWASKDNITYPANFPEEYK